jgi:hypothetical protein
VNTLAGPGTFVLHAGAYKQFLLTERVRVILEGTFTNILNHPSYALPNSDIRIRERGYHPVYLVDRQRRTANRRLGLRLEFWYEAVLCEGN